MRCVVVAKPGTVPMLSAEWINDRVDNVLDRLEEIMDHLIDDGLLVSGYMPFETPLTPALLRRMTPEQVQMLLDGAGSIDEQAQILEALEGLPAAVVPEPTPTYIE